MLITITTVTPPTTTTIKQQQQQQSTHRLKLIKWADKGKSQKK